MKALFVLLGMLIGGVAVYFIVPKKDTNGKTDPDIKKDTIVKKGVLGFTKFDQTSSRSISFEDAVKMHKLYMLDCWHAGEDTLRTSLRYLRIDKAHVETLLSRMPAGGSLRIYFGDVRALDKQKLLPNVLTTFLVGVDQNGRLILNRSLGAPSRAQDEIFDNLPPCPDNCPNPGDDPARGDGFN